MRQSECYLFLTAVDRFIEDGIAKQCQQQLVKECTLQRHTSIVEVLSINTPWMIPT